MSVRCPMDNAARIGVEKCWLAVFAVRTESIWLIAGITVAWFGILPREKKCRVLEDLPGNVQVTAY